MVKFALLHAAKENSGDFLIRDSAIALLKHHAGVAEDEIITVDIVGNTLCDDTLNKVADTEVAFLAGGPGYQPNFYPGIYPSMEDLLKVVDVIPLGPGWCGLDEAEYTFTDESIRVLQKIADQDRLPFLGARDLPTVRILRNHNLPAKLTGCPAWYWYYCGGKRSSTDIGAPTSVDTVIVSTPPRNSFRYLVQYFFLIRTLNEVFPDAKLVCSFHRGKYKDSLELSVGYPWRLKTWSQNIASVFYEVINQYAQYKDFELYDASGGSEYVTRYREADLHVGYRVHGHIPALSAGTPSFLLQIDGRGFGVSESLGTEADVSARTGIIEPVKAVRQTITRNVRNDFKDFETVDENISTAYQNMDTLLSKTI